MRYRVFVVFVIALVASSVRSYGEDAPKNPQVEAVSDTEMMREDQPAVGPNDGRLLEEIVPHAELFVREDRKIQITFLGEDGSILEPGAQSISAYCGKRTAPTKMVFEKKEQFFLSDQPLPEGVNIPTVIQIRMTPEAEKTTLRLNLNLAECPGCDHLEYACVCGHGDDHGDDHDHDHDHDHDADDDHSGHDH